MFVAATTACFSHLALGDAIEQLADLEFTNIELSLVEGGPQLQPSQVHAELQQAIEICSSTRRLNVVAYGLEIAGVGDEYLLQFESCCKLAKATRVVTLTVPSAELGTPFNQEVERLQRLVEIATRHGVRVGMRSQFGRLSADPDTVTVMCDHVDGLGLALDPSHYIYQQDSPRNVDRILKYVHHVYLRDSSRDKLQVRVGQGNVEYGRLINQLNRVKYRRTLCVDIAPMEDVDHHGELRKLRLLLESLLD